MVQKCKQVPFFLFLGGGEEGRNIIKSSKYQNEQEITVVKSYSGHTKRSKSTKNLEFAQTQYFLLINIKKKEEEEEKCACRFENKKVIHLFCCSEFNLRITSCRYVIHTYLMP